MHSFKEQPMAVICIQRHDISVAQTGTLYVGLGNMLENIAKKVILMKL